MSEPYLVEWIHDEQANLWSDLGWAIRTAHNGAWSMAAAGFAVRIISAARLVGPTPWGEVPTSLVAGGVYATLYELGQIPAQVPDEAEWERIDEVELRTGARVPTRIGAEQEFAPTVAAMRTDRQFAMDIQPEESDDQ